MSYELILSKEAKQQLKGDLSGLWSRRIDKGSRLVYSIEDDRVVVTVVSMKGHYGDK